MKKLLTFVLSLVMMLTLTAFVLAVNSPNATKSENSPSAAVLASKTEVSGSFTVVRYGQTSFIVQKFKQTRQNGAFFGTKEKLNPFIYTIHQPPEVRLE